jgi:phytanoyl-CoA hydroxylase
MSSIAPERQTPSGAHGDHSEAMDSGTELTDAQLEAFRAKGFLFLGQVVAGDRLQALQQRMDDLTGGRVRNEQIDFQIEPAVRRAMGIEVQGAYAWLGPSDHYRKLAHLDRDPLFLDYFVHPTFCAILRQLIGPEVSIQRAFGLLKPALDGSPLDWHQDAGRGFPAVRDRFFTVWTALDEADVGNGALLVLPGTQFLEPAIEEPVRQNREVAARMHGREIALPAKPGQAYLLDNYVLHSSGPNPTPRRRRAVTVCYQDAATPLVGREPDSHKGFTRLPMHLSGSH